MIPTGSITVTAEAVEVDGVLQSGYNYRFGADNKNVLGKQVNARVATELRAAARRLNACAKDLSPKK